MHLLKQHGFFILVFISSTLLRFLPLFDYQFTYDELSGLDRTQFSTYAEVLEKGVKIDAHPALIQLLIYFIVQSFGYVTWIIKLPFLIMSQAAIVYAYLFCYRQFGKQAANMAAVIFAFSLIFVFYAPIARMYIVGVFFSLALLYYFFEIVYSKKGTWYNYTLVGLFALLSGLNHHINALFAFSICVSGLFLLKEKERIYFLVTCILSALFYLPHLSITLYQLSVPGIGVDAGGWLTPPTWTALGNFLKTLFGTGYTWYWFAIIAVISFKRVPKENRKKLRFLVSLFLVNFFIVFFYSLFRSPIFQYSVMLFSATAMVLAVAACSSSGRTIFDKGIIGLSAFFLIFQTYGRKDYLHQAVKTVYEYQFAKTSEYKNKFGDQNVYPIFFDCDTLMRNIYFEKYKSHYDFKLSADTIVVYGNRAYFPKPGHSPSMEQDSMVSSIRLFSEFVSHLNSELLVLSSAPPLFQAIAREYFPYLIENTQTQAINYKVFSKKVGSTLPSDEIVYHSSALVPTQTNYSKNLPLEVDSLVEFPYSCSTDFYAAVSQEGQYVVAQTKLKLKRPTYNSLELDLSVGDKEGKVTYNYSGKSAGDYIFKKDSTVTVYADQYIGTNFSDIQKGALLKVYFWNRGKEVYEIESFQLFVYDYWPQKWHWWD